MCTRVICSGTDGMAATGRTMGWKTDMHSNLWVFPRGMERNGGTGKDSLKWKSKCSSIVTSAFEIASMDGANEKGLVANLLWLLEAQYPARGENKPGLAITIWVQYMLDNFATVEEAVPFINKGTLQVVSNKTSDGSRLATLHLSISDATGDCTIFEYIGGGPTTYHSREYKVMTDSPTYNKQLVLCEYWKSIEGLSFPPGTNRASGRSTRTSFYIDAVPKTNDEGVIVACIFSMIRNASVPHDISTPKDPGISTTQWRTTSKSKDLIYFFESGLTPSAFWIRLRDMGLSEDAPVLKLSTANGEAYHGNTSKDFKPA